MWWNVRLKYVDTIAALYCTKQTVPMSSAVALSEPSIDSRLLAGSATSCSSEAHACGVMSLPCKWQRRRVLVWASDADLEGSRWWGCGGAVSGRQHGGGAAPLRRQASFSCAHTTGAKGEPAGFGVGGHTGGLRAKGRFLATLGTARVLTRRSSSCCAGRVR